MAHTQTLLIGHIVKVTKRRPLNFLLTKTTLAIFTVGSLKLTTIESLLLFTLGFIPAIHFVFWSLLKLKFKACLKVFGVFLF